MGVVSVNSNKSVFFAIEADRLVVIGHVCQALFRLTVVLEPSATGTLVPWTQVFAA